MRRLAIQDALQQRSKCMGLMCMGARFLSIPCKDHDASLPCGPLFHIRSASIAFCFPALSEAQLPRSVWACPHACSKMLSPACSSQDVSGDHATLAALQLWNDSVAMLQF